MAPDLESCSGHLCGSCLRRARGRDGGCERYVGVSKPKANRLQRVTLNMKTLESVKRIS